MKSEKPFASIIITVKNDRGIDDTLTHLTNIKVDATYEVIVVDASIPSRLADIRKKHPWVKWDQFPPSLKVRTTPQQRNRGMELAKGEIICFIDANCIPGPNWLEAILSDIKGGKDIVCGPVLDSSKVNLVHYAANPEKGQYVDICTTISVGFTRRLIETIGIFDNTFAWGQDVDFFWRATDAGFRIYYDPEVVISHNWGDRKQQLSRAFDYGKARAHLFKKHWRTRYKELFYETHVWIYPLYIIGLPITFWFWPYPFLIFVPVLKNLLNNPVGLVVHHLVFGLGVIAGTIKLWPKDPESALRA